MLDLDKKTGLVIIDNRVLSVVEFREVTLLDNGVEQLTAVWYLCDHNSSIVKEGLTGKDALDKVRRILNLEDWKPDEVVKAAINYYNENCDGIAGKTVKIVEEGLRNIYDSAKLLNLISINKIKELQKQLELEDTKIDSVITDAINTIMNNQQILTKLANDLPNTIDKLIENKDRLKRELTEVKLAQGKRAITASMIP